jgi:hypothetical protein
MADEIQEEKLKPLELKPVTFSGEVLFSCCGQTQSVKGTEIQTVACKHCAKLYCFSLALRLSPAIDPIWPTGTILVLKESTKAKVGVEMMELEKGTKVRVHNDVYDILAIPSSLVPVVVSGKNRQGIPMISAIPPELLEPSKE